jgi:glycosyltransferase involved in cell wall biosynthesis
MRVLMVTRETAQDRRSGLGRSLEPLLAPMREAGVDVRYFCQEDLAAADIERRGAHVARLAGWPGLRGHPTRVNLLRAWAERLHAGWAAARVAVAQGYTHVHAHDPWIACGAALGLRARGAGRIRWGFTEHGFGSYSRATHEDGLTQGPRGMRWMQRIERAIAARADWVIAPTQAALAQLARDLGVRSQPAHWQHIPHPRPPLAPADAAQRAAAREQLGFAAGERVVLAVGRLAPLKCFDRIVQACAAQGDASLRLLVLGAGDASGLHALAAQLGFGAQLRVEATLHVAPYYHAADVYLSASSTESFGMANLEALCCGVPAICSAVGGVPEVMGDGAWLVPGDTASLERALRAMLQDESLRAGWAQRGLARAAGWPRAEEIAKRYVALYQAS